MLILSYKIGLTEKRTGPWHCGEYFLVSTCPAVSVKYLAVSAKASYTSVAGMMSLKIPAHAQRSVKEESKVVEFWITYQNLMFRWALSFFSCPLSWAKHENRQEKVHSGYIRTWRLPCEDEILKNDWDQRRRGRHEPNQAYMTLHRLQSSFLLSAATYASPESDAMRMIAKDPGCCTPCCKGENGSKTGLCSWTSCKPLEPSLEIGKVRRDGSKISSFWVESDLPSAHISCKISPMTYSHFVGWWATPSDSSHPKNKSAVGHIGLVIPWMNAWACSLDTHVLQGFFFHCAFTIIKY